MVTDRDCGAFFYLRVSGGYDSKGDVGDREVAVWGDWEPGFERCHLGGNCKGVDLKLRRMNSKSRRGPAQFPGENSMGIGDHL